MQLDAIREVGNIGTGNAATALSKMLSCKTMMDVPDVKFVSVYELSKYYGNPTDTVAAVFVRSIGGFMCSLIFIQPEEESHFMVELLLKQQFGTYIPYDEIPEHMSDSALTEVGNIVLSSFLNAINLLLGTQHQISVPGVAHDMLSSVLDVAASVFGQMGEMALLIKTELKVDAGKNEDVKDVRGNIILIPDPDALNVLLDKLKVS